MTFTNFLQVLAFNLLSNTIPLCLLLLVTAYLVIKMYDKKIDKIVEKKVDKFTIPSSRKKASADED